MRTAEADYILDVLKLYLFRSAAETTTKVFLVSGGEEQDQLGRSDQRKQENQVKC